MSARVAVLREGWPLTAASLTAWTLLLFGSFSPILPGLCGPGGALWSSVPAEIENLLRLTPLPQLLLWWLLMLCAMMLPLLHRPIGEVQARQGSVVRFVAAYLTVWLIAISAITLFSTTLRLLTEARPVTGGAIALGLAILWQGTTLKARCLERCTHAPHSGSPRAGLTVALACVGACWAWMALPPLFGPAHLPAMAVAAALLLYERQAQRVPRGDARLVLGGTILLMIAVVLDVL